jgi:hypothetical protein
MVLESSSAAGTDVEKAVQQTIAKHLARIVALTAGDIRQFQYITGSLLFHYPLVNMGE